MQTQSIRQPRFWRLQGTELSKSVLMVDESVTYKGQRSCFLKHESVESNERSVMVQTIGAFTLRKKRFCFSARVKTDSVKGRAALFVCILDAGTNYLLKDEMRGRELSGSNDWTELSVVIDVPEEARYINFGAQVIGGPGELWISDLSIGAVGFNIPVTEHGYDADSTTVGPANLDFAVVQDGLQEPQHWLFHSSPKNSTLLFEKGLKSTDSRECLWISSKQAQLSSKGDRASLSGTYSQTFNCVEWRGKRLRFSADIKCNNVDDWCGLMLRVCGIGNKTLAFSTMYDCPLSGESDWQKGSLVLDVSPVAWRIVLSTTLAGNGEVFFSNLSVSEVGPEEPTTDRQTLAKNLDFGEYYQF